MKQRQDIEERLANLEAWQRLLTNVLLGVVKEAKAKHPRFSIYALMAWFTAEELKEIEGFFRWATIEKDERKNLSRDTLVKEFEKRLPLRKDYSLESIARGYKREGMFPYICDIILGENLKKHGRLAHLGRKKDIVQQRSQQRQNPSWQEVKEKAGVWVINQTPACG